MRDSLIVPAPAKINLYLDIVSRRSDGYHEIVSIMQAVSLSDELTLTLTPRAGEVTVVCDDINIPQGSGNIAYSAAAAYLGTVGADFGVDISIVKSIPAAAGLGGGSSDAAAVLRGLNRLACNALSVEGLRRIALRLGADVPFCVEGGCSRAEGIGERLIKQPCIPDCDIVIAVPQTGVSTPQAYAALDAIYNDFKERHAELSDYYRAEAAIASGSLDLLCGYMYNIFEDCPADGNDIADIRRSMAYAGARGCLLSGSGPSVFGLFDDSATAATAAMLLRGRGYRAFNCRPVGRTTV